MHALTILMLLGADTGESSAERNDGLPARFERSLAGSLTPELLTFGQCPTTEIQSEESGLRLSVYAAHEGQTGVGMCPRLQISGDFEITLSYALLSVERPDTGFGAGVKIWARIGDPQQHAITLARFRCSDDEDRFVALNASWDGARNQREQQALAATKPDGRLRLSRTGSILTYAAADGEDGEFRDFHVTEIGTGDITSLRIQATASGGAVPVDVRLHNLTIRANRLDNRAVGSAASGGVDKLWIVGIVNVVVVAVILVVRRLMRQRRGPDSPSTQGPTN